MLARRLNKAPPAAFNRAEVEMWNWIRRWFDSQEPSQEDDPEILRFVRGLCEKNPSPRIVSDIVLGYLVKIQLFFPDIKITLEYSQPRQSWLLFVWNESSGSYMYNEECFQAILTMVSSAREREKVFHVQQAIQYLLVRFDLLNVKSQRLSELRERNEQKRLLENETKRKYL